MYNLQVHEDGFISVTAASLHNTTFISPYSADVDLTLGLGEVWYRDASSESVVQQLVRDQIRSTRPFSNFEPTFVFVATWDAVRYYDRGQPQLGNINLVSW